VVNDNEVRVRVPDLGGLAAPEVGAAGSSGVLAVRTATGPAQADLPFTFDLARATAIQQRVQRTPYDPAGVVLVDYPEVRRAAPYGLQLPMAPVFHPLVPRADPPNAPEPSFILNLKLPPPFFQALPEIVRMKVRALGIDPANVDIFLEAQHNVWVPPLGPDSEDPASQYEFHPHYWVYPDVLAANDVEQSAFLEDGLIDPGAGGFADVQFRHHVAEDQQGIQVPKDQVATQAIRFAPNGPDGAMQALGDRNYLDGLDFGVSHALWSVTRLNERAAVTLHLLLGDNDQALVAAATADHGLLTLGMLIQAIAAEPEFGVGTALTYLARPVVTRVEHQGGDNQFDYAFLRGDMLGENPRVTVDGLELAADQVVVLSDAMLVLRVARGTAGQVVVETGLGRSDAITLQPPVPQDVPAL
jgi:hypothetical protein